MTLTGPQIKAITQSVLRELASRGVTIAADSLAPMAVANPERQNVEAVASVGLTQKVVTEAALIDANAAGLTISIPAGAIITPSGHDYIRRNGVTISNAVAIAANSQTGALIVIGSHSAATSAAATAKWQTISAGCEFDAAAKSKGHSSTPVVCLGGEPSLTACLVNRDASVRAAVVTQHTNVNALLSAMNPRIVCIDSTTWSFATLLKLFRQLSTGNCQQPSAWKELPGGAQ